MPTIFLSTVLRKYAGTRLGRQELEAELLENIEGALWKRSQIEVLRVLEYQLPSLNRIVVAIIQTPLAKRAPTSTASSARPQRCAARTEVDIVLVVVGEVRVGARAVSGGGAYCFDVQDSPPRELFEKLMADEEGHIDFLETQIDLIGRIGLERYTQAHIDGLGEAYAAKSSPACRCGNIPAIQRIGATVSFVRNGGAKR